MKSRKTHTHKPAKHWEHASRVFVFMIEKFGACVNQIQKCNWSTYTRARVFPVTFGPSKWFGEGKNTRWTTAWETNT